jgi:hypothetical protein
LGPCTSHARNKCHSRRSCVRLSMDRFPLFSWGLPPHQNSHVYAARGGKNSPFQPVYNEEAAGPLINTVVFFWRAQCGASSCMSGTRSFPCSLVQVRVSTRYLVVNTLCAPSFRLNLNPNLLTAFDAASSEAVWFNVAFSDIYLSTLLFKL